MGAMTMEFKLPPPNKRPRGLAVGDRVDFEFYVDPTDGPTVTTLTLLPPSRPHAGRRRPGSVAMIAALIRWSIVNRFLVLLATVIVTAWGLWAVQRTPLDALPDLSDVQVIIRTTYPGQAPRIVENQVTYPLTTTMLSVPGAKVVRGYSFFGDCFVYVLFEDGTDPYWARSRVLEYLNQVQSRLPAAGEAGARAGRDRRGLDLPVRAGGPQRHDGRRAAARAAGLVPEVRAEDRAERRRGRHRSAAWCASTRCVLDPDKLRAYDMPHGAVIDAIRNANQEAGGSVLELGEAEYMVRASGYLATLDDFRKIPLSATDAGVSGAPGRRGARPGRARRCAAASPNSTARARSPAA